MTRKFDAKPELWDKNMLLERKKDLDEVCNVWLLLLHKGTNREGFLLK